MSPTAAPVDDLVPGASVLKEKERGLSTARAVLSVLSFVAESQAGVSARDVADRLHKSLSTAYHLLASLEAEGFVTRMGRAGCYRLVTDKLGGAVRAPGCLPAGLERTLDAGMRRVFTHTGRRTSVALCAEDGVAVVRDLGRQGLPRMGNVEKPLIRETAHALAIGKVWLAGLQDDRFEEWVGSHRLPSYTPTTIADPTALRRELRDVREQGYAVDRGEFDPGFASVAAPVMGPAHRPVAVIAVTLTRHQFAAEHDKLRRALLGATRDLGDTQA